MTRFEFNIDPCKVWNSEIRIKLLHVYRNRMNPLCHIQTTKSNVFIFAVLLAAHQCLEQRVSTPPSIFRRRQ